MDLMIVTFFDTLPIANVNFGELFHAQTFLFVFSLQAEFKDINLAAYSDAGTLVDINVYRNGTHVLRYEKKIDVRHWFGDRRFHFRSFRPDFVLVRQYVRDINVDWTNIILGMQYGAVPGVNSMKALYNFRDKPWIVSRTSQFSAFASLPFSSPNF